MHYTTETIQAHASNTNYPATARINNLIKVGLAELDLELGIVSHIFHRKYVVKYSNNTDLVGEVFRLGETYCSITMRLDSARVMAIRHFAVSQYFRHPAYEHFKLETYIATPIYVHGKQYGTLNFTKPYLRNKPFGDADKQLMICLSDAIGQILAEKDHVAGV